MVKWGQRRARERVACVRRKVAGEVVRDREVREEREEKVREERRVRVEGFVRREEERVIEEREEWVKEVRREGKVMERRWRESESGGGGDLVRNAVERVVGNPEGVGNPDGDTEIHAFERYLEGIEEVKREDFVMREVAARDKLLQYTKPNAGVCVIPNQLESEKEAMLKEQLEYDSVDVNELVPFASHNIVAPARLQTPVRRAIVRAISGASPSTTGAIKDASVVIERQQREIKEIQERVRVMQMKSDATPVKETPVKEKGAAVFSPDSLEKRYTSRVVGQDSALASAPAARNVVFHIYSAHGLPQPLASCNAYCVYKCYGRGEESGVVVVGEGRTGVCKNTTSPVFDKVKSTWRVVRGWERVEVWVYSKNVFISDEYIGKGVVQAAVHDENEDFEIAIVGKAGESAGTLRGRVDTGSWFA